MRGWEWLGGMVCGESAHLEDLGRGAVVVWRRPIGEGATLGRYFCLWLLRAASSLK